ncbi:MAG: ABC transporter substrate-binding protein [Spirochaetales bacterium]|jgi:simple sugar transport system substrate-binding protein|nr:ABC transporter substrate-binding protein [Spirochaetales bacterium]
MKKLCIVLFGLALACQMAFAGGGGEQAAGNVSKKKDKYVVGFSQVGSESEWRIAMSNEMQEEYAAHPRFTLIFSDAQQKQENQIAAMRNFIQQKVDAIVLCPVVATGWDAILSEAKDADIPVLLVNRTANTVGNDIEKYTTCFIGPDNIYAGELAAEALMNALAGEQGSVNIVELQGTVGASSAVDRGTGIHNVLDKQNKINIRYSQTGDYTRSLGKQVMESILKSAQAEGITIRGLLAHSDNMALGASQAIAEAGLKPGVDIKIVGVDGVRGAFEAMAEGLYTASVENPLGFGKKTIEVITDILDNNTYPAEWWVKLKNDLYTEANAAAALPQRKY